MYSRVCSGFPRGSLGISEGFLRGSQEIRRDSQGFLSLRDSKRFLSLRDAKRFLMIPLGFLGIPITDSLGIPRDSLGIPKVFLGFLGIH